MDAGIEDPRPDRRDNPLPKDETTVTREDLQKEREASAERRKERLEKLRRDAPAEEAPFVRRLTAAEKRKLQDEEFVAPND